VVAGGTAIRQLACIPVEGGHNVGEAAHSTPDTGGRRRGMPLADPHAAVRHEDASTVCDQRHASLGAFNHARLRGSSGIVARDGGTVHLKVTR